MSTTTTENTNPTKSKWKWLKEMRDKLWVAVAAKIAVAALALLGSFALGALTHLGHWVLPRPHLGTPQPVTLNVLFTPSADCFLYGSLDYETEPNGVFLFIHNSNGTAAQIAGCSVNSQARYTTMSYNLTAGVTYELHYTGHIGPSHFFYQYLEYN